MSYSVDGYRQRAQECVDLAAKAVDPMIRVELLKLRQIYLNIADRLHRQGFEIISHRQQAANPIQERRSS